MGWDIKIKKKKQPVDSYQKSGLKKGQTFYRVTGLGGVYITDFRTKKKAMDYRKRRGTYTRKRKKR